MMRATGEIEEEIERLEAICDSLPACYNDEIDNLTAQIRVLNRGSSYAEIAEDYGNEPFPTFEAALLALRWMEGRGPLPSTYWREYYC